MRLVLYTRHSVEECLQIVRRGYDEARAVRDPGEGPVAAAALTIGAVEGRWFAVYRWDHHRRYEQLFHGWLAPYGRGTRVSGEVGTPHAATLLAGALAAGMLGDSILQNAARLVDLLTGQRPGPLEWYGLDLLIVGLLVLGIVAYLVYLRPRSGRRLVARYLENLIQARPEPEEARREVPRAISE